MDLDHDFRSGLRSGEYRDALIVASEDWLVREAVSRILGAAFNGVTVDSIPTTPPPVAEGTPIICGIRILADASSGGTGGSHWAVLLADPQQPGGEVASEEGQVLTNWRSRPDLIVSAVGEQLRSRQATRRGAGAVTGGSRNPALRLLTRRQLEVVRLIAQGKPNAEIATMLGMSENTVRIHVSAILKTLGLANRTQAALWATQNLMSEQAAR